MHCTRFTRCAAIGFAGLALAAAVGTASAQVGEKTIRFILPNATGLGVDAITRAAQPALVTVPFDMPGDFTPIAIVGETPAWPTPRAATAPSCTWPRRCMSTRRAARRATSRTRVLDRWRPDLIGGQVDFATAALPTRPWPWAFADLVVMEAMARLRTPKFAQQYFRGELAKYAKLVKKARIELQ